MKITPKLNPAIEDFIFSQDLFALKNLSDGVIHLGFPQEIKINIERFKTILNQYGVNYKIYFAHKASKNQAFVKEALKQNIGIDVASENELISALSCGFTGDNIEATGPKNNSFLRLALFHNCLISLDSVEELKRLVEIYKKLHLDRSISVLIRLNNPEILGRNIETKKSRFGSHKEDLSVFYEKIKEYEFINFKGFHFHADGYDPSMRSGILDGLTNLLTQAYEYGLTPDIINIGGSFRDQTLNNYNEWSNYLEDLENQLINNKVSTWGNENYGLFVNDKGKIGGKEKAMSKFYKSSFDKDLSEILGSNNQEDRNLSTVLNENMFKLVLEPGYSLLQQVGISIVKITEVKKIDDNTNIIITDANIYNLGLAKMFQYITDPIHIPKQNNSDDRSKNTEEFKALVGGNLCREDDLLINREVYFDSKPKSGDLLIFTNTAPYLAGFEDATPIMHPTSLFLAAIESRGKWEIMDPKNYDPFENNL